jgi:1,2-phenylacetyl-CoA epoxidase PaaB subunit
MECAVSSWAVSTSTVVTEPPKKKERKREKNEINMNICCCTVSRHARRHEQMVWYDIINLATSTVSYFTMIYLQVK